MSDISDRIKQLKKEKNAVILAHYYVDGEVQQIADYVGDSFYLSKIAVKVPQQIVVFCGVSFMGESTKILNPDKTILMPDQNADCPMAHMVTVEEIQQVRKEYPSAAVVCYINSAAEIKAHADVCVTSSNALKIVSKLPNKEIFFIPDNNLGHYIASCLPEKTFLFHDGYCPVHKKITESSFLNLKAKYPDTKFLAHPECTADVLAHADYIGSTSGILDYTINHEDKEFIIGTEIGILYELQQKSPDKIFHFAGDLPACMDMKLITLEKIVTALETMEPQVHMDEKLRKAAELPLQKMLELAAD
ncbi:MAG: quinolinate synthase NadA [Lachnospiraceae bacterium]|jgi:quinolinate synthase|nr:quinolinate synthase NadA [Lachnospiraceae bacterium]